MYLTKVPAPRVSELRDGEVLLEVTAVGICGSDIPKFLNGGPLQLPGWPAHEIVATVIAGRSVQMATGARVVGLASSHNGLSQRVISSAETLIEVPPQMPDEEAVVIQPLATAHAALSRVRTMRGASVTIIGLGPLGLLLAHLAGESGAAAVTGIDRIDRSAIAAAFNVHETVWSGSHAWATGPGATHPADVVIEAVGHQTGTLNDAIAIAAPDGHVVGFGVPDDSHYGIDYLTLFRKRLTLTAGTTHPWQPHLTEARAHLLTHPEIARKLITHVLPACAASHGYELAAKPEPSVQKVVINLTSFAA